MNDFISDIGGNNVDFVAMKKLYYNRYPVKDFRTGRCARFLFWCCRSKNFDIMMGEARRHIRDELDIVRYI